MHGGGVIHRALVSAHQILIIQLPPPTFQKVSDLRFFPPAHLMSLAFPQVVLVAQSCPTLCNPMDCSPPGSSVRGILQARVLEWVAIPFSRAAS